MTRIAMFCLLIVLALPGTDLRAQYYQRAIGLRAGPSFGLSYKHIIKRGHGIEAIVGMRLAKGVELTALYEYHIDLGFDTGFGAYFGGGLSNGFFFDQSPGRYGAAILAIAGAEYTFRPWPINISVDYMPLLGYRSTWLSGALSIRYGF